MRERGILFGDEMVRAILDGRKTQTRRVVKNIGAASELRGAVTFVDARNGTPIKCHYGRVGDRLWVRETWAPCTTEGPVDDIESADAAMYRADGAAMLYTGTEDARPWHRKLDPYCWKPSRWRPSIFMPRWASRITLEITEVRVQRLKNISEDDAKAEGCPSMAEAFEGMSYLRGAEAARAVPNQITTARYEYARLWERINGDGSWNANPWVWAITFKRIEASARAA